jgi:hypothetical protein
MEPATTPVDTKTTAKPSTKSEVPASIRPRALLPSITSAAPRPVA